MTLSLFGGVDRPSVGCIYLYFNISEPIAMFGPLGLPLKTVVSLEVCWINQRLHSGAWRETPRESKREARHSLQKGPTGPHATP